jgi:hypothetical protein
MSINPQSGNQRRVVLKAPNLQTVPKGMKLGTPLPGRIQSSIVTRPYAENSAPRSPRPARDWAPQVVEVRYTRSEREDYRFTGKDVGDVVARICASKDRAMDPIILQRILSNRNVLDHSALNMVELNELVANYFLWG